MLHCSCRYSYLESYLKGIQPNWYVASLSCYIAVADIVIQSVTLKLSSLIVCSITVMLNCSCRYSYLESYFKGIRSNWYVASLSCYIAVADIVI